MSIRLGLIGKKIGYSKSPLLHLEIAHYLNVSLFYEIIDIDLKDIENYISQLRKGYYQGFNVTIPYKTLVMPYLDKISNKAKIIGAVNTIYMDGDFVVGDNTDSDGFLEMIKYFKIDLVNQSICILGTGGAAKAVYYALSTLKAKMKVVSRHQDHHDYIFNQVETYESLDQNSYDVIIQATPVGTYPNINETPLSKTYVENKTVIDLIYKPKETQMMKYAKIGYNGTMMLIFQGIKSACLFYNKDIEIDEKLIHKLKEVIENE